MNPAQLFGHFDRVSEAPDAIPRLRRFILELAVRGKLVEQDRNDESTSGLLELIQEERARLLKGGAIKKLEMFKQVDANEIPFPVPSGWEVMRMGWLARKLGAGSTPLGGKSVYQSEGVPFLRSQNVHDDGLRLDDVVFISRAIHDRMAGTHVQQGDILLNITGASIGRCGLVPNTFVEGNVSQHVAIIRFFLPSIREFIHLSLTSPFFRQLIDDVQVGVSREGLSMQRLRLFPMLLPPLAEQKRIVAKVDKLMALCDRLERGLAEREIRRDRLAAASLHRLNQSADGPEFREHARFHLCHLPRLTTRAEQIPALRQTILNLAVRGKLVEQDSRDEPAAELLKRIQVEKVRLLKEGKLRRMEPAPQIDDQELPFCAPASWAWARLATISRRIHYGFTASANQSLKDVRFLRITDIQNNSVDWSSIPGCEISDREVDKYKLEEGDILIARTGGTIGKTFLVRQMPVTAVFASYLIRVQCSSELFDQYLKLFLESPVYWKQLEDGARGGGQPNVNSQTLGQMTVTIPPLAEQKRVVAKVEELLALCQRLVLQLTTAQTESRRLLEAVLHEALAGQSRGGI